MATSYGSITIVDITDIGEFSVYPTANSPRTQIYNPDTNGYIPDWSGSDPDTSLKITPVAYYASQNVSTAATYTWQRRDGAGNLTELGANETVITVSGNTGVLKVNNNVLGNSTSGIISYIVTAHYVVDGVTLEAVGEIDFSLTRQGTIAKTAKINGENIFKYNTAGALTPAGKTITLNGTVVGVSITGWQYKNGSSWTTYPNSSNTSTLVVDPSDNVFTNDSVTIKLVTNDSSTYDLFTITKLRDGAAGQEVLSAILSNEDQMLPADKNGKVIAYTGATSTLTIYEGDTDVTSGWTISKSYTPTALGDLDTAVNNNTADFTSTSASSTVLSGYDTASVTFTCTKSGHANIVKTFSLVKIKTGADGTSPIIYSLKPSSLVVNTDPVAEGVHPNPNPSSITFNAYQQQGDAEPAAYEGRIQFYIDNNSSIAEAVAVNSSSRTINFNNSPWNAASKIKAVLYEANANTKQLDSQTIVIVCDGAQGAAGEAGGNGFGAVNVILGNEADVIPCTSSNHPIPNGTGADSDKFIIDIPYEGYQGTSLKTTAVNAPSLSSNDFGVTVASDTTTAGHVKYKIPNTATLIEGGQINLTFTVSAQDYDTNGDIINTTVSVSKIYTWTRSSAAINGVNAVILQVVAEDGTIFENNTGTLTAKGLLYNGTTQETTNVSYKWYKYTNGYTEITSTSSSDNVYKNAAGDILTIKAAAVDGYASFKLEAVYDNKTYTQYISFIDKSDPLQVSLHSTVGTQIKNSQGMGCVYARVTQGNTEIDQVPQGLQTGTTYPGSPVANDYFVLLSTNENKSLRTARLYQYKNSSWTAVASKAHYEWSFRDENNVPVTTGVPYQDTTNTKNNQFIYIDASLIDGKITIDCKVTLD